jgi:hypothetical protein
MTLSKKIVQLNGTLSITALYTVMLSVVNKTIMLRVIMLSVVLLSTPKWSV